MTADEYRRRLLDRLAECERQIESYKTVLQMFELERGRIRYCLNQHTPTVPRAQGDLL